MRLSLVVQATTVLATWATWPMLTVHPEEAGAPRTADKAIGSLDAAAVVRVLGSAGLASIEVGRADDRLLVSAQAPAYRDPMVALGVMGSVVARMAPDVRKVVIEVRRGQRSIISAVTSASAFAALMETRFSPAQRAAVQEALTRVRWDARDSDARRNGNARVASSPAAPSREVPPSSPGDDGSAVVAPEPAALAFTGTTGDLEASPSASIGSPGSAAETAFDRAHRTAESLADQLAAVGLENVRVAVRPSRIVAQYENRVFRNDLTALGFVIGAAAEMARIDDELVAIPKRRNVPVIAIIAEAVEVRRFMRGRTTPLEFRSALRVSQNVGRFIRHQPGEEQTHRLNTSRGRLDVTAEPHLSYRLGQVEDPFVADLFFRPGAEVFLGGGIQAGLRADFIADEGDGRLDRAYVSRFARPRSRRFVLATAFGQIAAGVRAWHGEGLLTSADDRARFGGSISFVGENLFDLDEGRHGRSFLGLLECEVQPLDLTLRASGGQFLSGDRGVRLDLVRRFDEREMTFSGVHTDFGDKWAFNLRVPLGPETLPRPHCGRLRWAEDADVEYRSTILDLGETIDYDFSLRAFRDELSGPYIVQHPEELRRAVTHLRRAGLLPADVSAHVETEPKARPYPTWWPSVLGRSGLVVAPTADTLGDGEYAFGVGFIDRDHTMQFGRTWKRTASIAPYAAFGFLPGLEVGMRYTIYPSLNAYDWGYSTNRAPYAHLRVLRESGRRPALAAFAEDLAGAPVEETYGVVASKRMGSLQLSAGWGSGRFRGVFGGIACPIGRRARVVGEYDSRFVNLGAAVQLDSLRVQLALLNLDGVAAGVSYWGRLH